MNQQTMDKLAAEYFELQLQIAQLNERAEHIKDQLKNAMVERSAEELHGLGWRATWHSVSTNRFDSNAFKEQHSELYVQFCKTKMTTRFTLNQIKGGR